MAQSRVTVARARTGGFRQPSGPSRPPPGAERPRRFRPRLRWELLGCALHGHALVGTRAARVGPEDALVAREGPGLRWHRCLRCDAWVPLSVPHHPTRPTPPRRDQIAIPLRGRPLRERFMLRLIAIERAVHVLALAVLSATIFVFATHRQAVGHLYYQTLDDLQGALGGPLRSTHARLLGDINHIFTVNLADVYLTGALVSAYTVLLAAEAVGLWRTRRWAEYMTALEATVFMPLEVYELLTHGPDALNLLGLTLNVVILSYLLLVHRLFGVRGGGRAKRAEHDRACSWEALALATPEPWPLPAPAGAHAAGTAPPPGGVRPR